LFRAGGNCRTPIHHVIVALCNEMFNNLNCTDCFVCHTRTRYHKSKCQMGSNILLSSKDHISPILGTNSNNNNNWFFHVLNSCGVMSIHCFANCLPTAFISQKLHFVLSFCSLYLDTSVPLVNDFVHNVPCDID
jgi:hypothetical protein